MQIPPVQSVPQGPAAPSETRIREAARDFEALLIAQVLQSFRGESMEGCLGGDGGSASSTMMEFAGQHLAQVMSRQGGLGLHDLLVQGLLPKTGSAVEAQPSGGQGVSAPAGQGAGVESGIQPAAAAGVGDLTPGVG